MALAAVDEGLLELSGNDSWDLLKRMMGERGLEVLTATAQMQVVGKRHYGRKAVPHGGGGGRGAAARDPWPKYAPPGNRPTPICSRTMAWCCRASVSTFTVCVCRG